MVLVDSEKPVYEQVTGILKASYEEERESNKVSPSTWQKKPRFSVINKIVIPIYGSKSLSLLLIRFLFYE